MANHVICTYRVKPEHEMEFADLLADHWPALSRLDFVTEEKPQRYRGEDDGHPVFVEIFEWKPGGASAAHEHPEVAAIWERMNTLVDSWSFPHFDRIA